MQTIAIDFDGVIHKYSKGWNGGVIYDDPVEGAVEAYYELIKNYNVVIFTAREDTDAVKKWMEKHFDFEKNLGHFYEPIVTNIKPPAIAYIDDRGITFTDWVSTLKELNVIDQDPEATAVISAKRKRIQNLIQWAWLIFAFISFSYFGYLWGQMLNA
jgi:hypothetical protein